MLKGGRGGKRRRGPRPHTHFIPPSDSIPSILMCWLVSPRDPTWGISLDDDPRSEEGSRLKIIQESGRVILRIFFRVRLDEALLDFPPSGRSKEFAAELLR